MLEIASREIAEARKAFDGRRQADRRRQALMVALDRALAELEELGLAGSTRAPASCRASVAALVARVFGLDRTPTVPRSVSRLMDVVYAAADAELQKHRRAAWGPDANSAGARLRR